MFPNVYWADVTHLVLGVFVCLMGAESCWYFGSRQGKIESNKIDRCCRPPVVIGNLISAIGMSSSFLFRLMGKCICESSFNF